MMRFLTPAQNILPEEIPRIRQKRVMRGLLALGLVLILAMLLMLSGNDAEDSGVTTGENIGQTETPLLLNPQVLPDQMQEAPGEMSDSGIAVEDVSGLPVQLVGAGDNSNSIPLDSSPPAITPPAADRTEAPTSATPRPAAQGNNRQTDNRQTQTASTTTQPLARPAQTPAKTVSAPPAKGSYRIVVGDFLEPTAAGQLRAQIDQAGYTLTMQNRVAVGPYHDKTSAEETVTKLQQTQQVRGIVMATGQGQWIVQVGVFSDAANAQKLRRQLSSAGYPAQVHMRPLVGPFNNKKSADQALQKLQQSSSLSGTVIEG